MYLYNAPPTYRHHEAWYRSRLWRRREISKEDYCWRNPLMPILNIFRLLGRMPFYRDGKDSTLKFKLLSTPVIWAVISNCALVIFVGMIYYWKITHDKYWRNFDTTLISITELGVLNNSFHGLEATWAATPAIVRAVNRWEAYQKRLHTVVRRPVSTKLLDHSYVGLVVILIPSTHLLLEHLLRGEVHSLFHVIKEMVYFVCMYYNFLVFWLWIVFCSLVIKSGKVLKDSFIESTSKFPSPEMVSLHRDLWLELHGCVKDMASALATTLVAWNVLLFFATLLGSYGLIVYIKTFNYTPLASYIVFVTNVHLIGYLMYSYGYFAQQALEILTDSIQMGKPCFDMREYFVFDRNTHIKMLQLLLTYLVVIVQFKVQSAG